LGEAVFNMIGCQPAQRGGCAGGIKLHAVIAFSTKAKSQSNHTRIM
jgi:hypothetical protein